MVLLVPTAQLHLHFSIALEHLSWWLRRRVEDLLLLLGRVFELRSCATPTFIKSLSAAVVFGQLGEFVIEELLLILLLLLLLQLLQLLNNSAVRVVV